MSESNRSASSSDTNNDEHISRDNDFHHSCTIPIYLMASSTPQRWREAKKGTKSLVTEYATRASKLIKQ